MYVVAFVLGIRSPNSSITYLPAGHGRSGNFEQSLENWYIYFMCIANEYAVYVTLYDVYNRRRPPPTDSVNVPAACVLVWLHMFLLNDSAFGFLIIERERTVVVCDVHRCFPFPRCQARAFTTALRVLFMPAFTHTDVYGYRMLGGCLQFDAACKQTRNRILCIRTNFGKKFFGCTEWRFRARTTLSGLWRIRKITIRKVNMPKTKVFCRAASCEDKFLGLAGTWTFSFVFRRWQIDL